MTRSAAQVSRYSYQDVTRWYLIGHMIGLQLHAPNTCARNKVSPRVQLVLLMNNVDEDEAKDENESKFTPPLGDSSRTSAK